jgi:small subunit ribosomal protein S8
MMTDPIADMLTRIRNAGRARHAFATCPTSKLKMAVAKVMSDEGFIGEVTQDASGTHPAIKIGIRYADDGRWMIDGIRRISRPGRRVYVGAGEVPMVRNGLGMMVLSTSRGVMCDRDARSAHIGGEVLCEVW